MKTLVTAAAAALLLFIAPISRAQTPMEQNAPIPTSKISLTVEQRNDIKEIVKDLGIENSAAGIRFTIGDTLPNSFPLRPMPPEVSAKVSQVKSHLFLVMDGKVVIVDAKDNKIVDIIE